MKQSQLLRHTEAVSFGQEAGIDGDEVELGKDVTFDLSGFDATVGDQPVLGGGCLAMQACAIYKIASV